MEDPTSTGFQMLFTSAYRYRMRGLVIWVLASSIVIVFSMIFLVARTASAFIERRVLDRTIAELDGRTPELTTTDDVPGVAVVSVWASDWSTSQDQLFISSIFPTAPSSLGFAMACPAAVLPTSAVTPITDPRPIGSGRTSSERGSHEHIDSPASVS